MSPRVNHLDYWQAFTLTFFTKLVPLRFFFFQICHLLHRAVHFGVMILHILLAKITPNVDSQYTQKDLPKQCSGRLLSEYSIDSPKSTFTATLVWQILLCDASLSRDLFSFSFYLTHSLNLYPLLNLALSIGILCWHQQIPVCFFKLDVI